MEIIDKIEVLRKKLKEERKKGKTIGFVPTMGYLHEGHLALVREAVKDNDITVVSIFVNPAQFGPEEDYEEYPRDLERDASLAGDESVDYIFAPSNREMYFKGHKSFVEVENLTDKLCGRTREGHFRGVTTVVSKLFNIVRPDRAYFGQKDYQQFVVIKQMVKDLNFSLDLKMVPIVREDDGLALSSRNKYLSDKGRKTAPVLYKAIQRAREMIVNGEKNVSLIKSEMVDMINGKELTEIEYIKIVDPDTLEGVSRIEDDVVIALAVYVEDTRLIDNIYIGRKEF